MENTREKGLFPVTPEFIQKFDSYQRRIENLLNPKHAKDEYRAVGAVFVDTGKGKREIGIRGYVEGLAIRIGKDGLKYRAYSYSIGGSYEIPVDTAFDAIDVEVSLREAILERNPSIRTAIP